MTAFTSVGDLSRMMLLRPAGAQLKARMLTLTQEAATGLKSDVPAALNGQMGRLAQLQDRLTLLQAHAEAAHSVRAELEGLQTAMEAMQKLGGGLLPAANMADATSLGVRSNEARQDFHAAVGLLDVAVAGRHLLSGTAIETPPLSDAAAILDDARAQVAGLTDPAQIAATLDAWFTAPLGAGGFADVHFQGNADPREVRVAPGETIRQDRNALDPAFLGLLKGLALGALAADPGLSREQGATLLDAAGTRIAGAATALTQRRADLGLQEAVVERAASRNAAETLSLSLIRSDMLAADPYDTATALTETEASLQNLYALTSRLSRLSLTDYL